MNVRVEKPAVPSSASTIQEAMNAAAGKAFGSVLKGVDAMMWTSVWISAQPVTKYVLTLWERTTVPAGKATESEVMGKLASVSHCEEFYCVFPKRLPPSFSSSGATETTYSLTQPVLPSLSSQTQIFPFCSLCCSFSFVPAASHLPLQGTF